MIQRRHDTGVVNQTRRRRVRNTLAIAIFFCSFQDASSFSSVYRKDTNSIPSMRSPKNDAGGIATSVELFSVGRKAGVAAGAPTNPETTANFQELPRRVSSHLKDNDYSGAKELISSTLEFLEEQSDLSGKDRAEVCGALDEALQAFYRSAFSPPYRSLPAKSRIMLGIELMGNQLASPTLVSPYNEIPKRAMLSALRALTGLNEVQQMDVVSSGLTNTDTAYRILQRLVTGVGVRGASTQEMKIYESDFNMVLNAYSNVGRMDMAHRVIALQERTSHAPMLSPVAYSILLKGYGRLGDMNNIDNLIAHAEANSVEPDTIMLNSLIDGYINCGEFDKAQDVFEFIKNPNIKNGFSSDHPKLFTKSKCPTPNNRTFNTYLKGLANRGLLDEALHLSDEMQLKGLWDHVTTNTLVQAAVNAEDFDTAEDILKRHTAQPNNKKSRKGSHPNAEAYTTAMDGFAKHGNLPKAIELLKRMKDRGVEPNDFTYTCIIGGLARNKKIEQAKRMMKHMKSVGFRPKVVTYNACISGLTQRERFDDGDAYDTYVDEAVLQLKQMMKEGIRPNAITVSVLVDAFAKCDFPRVSQAVALVDRLESQGIISGDNMRISTALIKIFGAGGDIEGAMATFQQMRDLDVPAINALLDTCVRCNKDEIAKQVFDQHFRNSNSNRQRPDVISFSCMMTSLLKKVSYEGSKEARILYEEMKYRRRIMPDTGLVNIILKAMIEHGKTGFLASSDVRFIACVLRDAEKLDWGEGQLERRKRLVQTIMTGRIAGTWEEESGLYGLKAADDSEDTLFKKYGWNKVDSGFRLWGADKTPDNSKSDNDDFLQSKGWNGVNSGFRII